MSLVSNPGLTQFEDLPQEDLDYLLDKLGDVLTVAE
jgi:hypothetical protein